MTDPIANTEPVTTPREAYDVLRNVSEESPCPYLPGRQSRSEVYGVARLDGALYESLLAKGFRRSGRVVYRPRCRGCIECRQLRVCVDEFRPTRSMRRVWRRNADVAMRVCDPVATPEKFRLFRRYLDSQHDGTMSRGYESFHGFLYDSPARTLEFEYRLGELLIGVGIADYCRDGLSSVYMYFDPTYASRSLGTLSALREIAYCKELAMRYYYLGYYVANSRTMAYKARFRPNLILVGEDQWVSLRE